MVKVGHAISQPGTQDRYEHFCLLRNLFKELCSHPCNKTGAGRWSHSVLVHLSNTVKEKMNDKDRKMLLK